MLVFILRRLLYAPFLLFGVALVTFIVFNIVGGNPVYTLAGKNASPKLIHSLTVQYGFDRPLFADLDFAQRRLHVAAIQDATAQLSTGGQRTEQLKRLLKRVQNAFDELDEQGEDAFSSDGLPHLRADIKAAGLDPAEPSGAGSEERLVALSEAVLAASADEAARQVAALQVLRRYLRVAVPELVQLVLGDTDAATKTVASYELDTLLFDGFAIVGTDSAAEASAKVERVRKWWASNQADYAYEFRAGKTLTSLVHSQFSRYLVEVFTFDFGESYKLRGTPVMKIIREGAPVSLMLTLPAFLLGTIVAVLVGLLSAFYQGRLIDRAIVIVSVLGMSVSILVFIILGQVILAHKLGWFPVQGYEGLAGVKYFVLPWILFMVADFGGDVRFFRTAMVDELGRDYIRTARAKGLSNKAVMLRHLLKNAMIPILTYVIIALPGLYTGSLLLEKYFSIPGLGAKTVEAVLSSDFPVIKAMTVIGSVLFIIADIVTNVAYAIVDPRVRLS